MYKDLPVCGSAGKSVSLLLAEKEDLTGTGKNPLRKRATDKISNMRHNKANTDELSFMMKINTLISLIHIRQHKHCRLSYFSLPAI